MVEKPLPYGCVRGDQCGSQTRGTRDVEHGGGDVGDGQPAVLDDVDRVRRAVDPEDASAGATVALDPDTDLVGEPPEHRKAPPVCR